MASPTIKLASGLELHCINAIEAQFLGTEVDEYFRHGIDLERGATVLDVGANIGVFSALVFERLGGDVRIFAFEPLPPIHVVLAENAATALKGKMKALPYGLSSRDDEVEFTYFPLLTILSSNKRGKENIEHEKKRLANSLVQMIREGRILPRLKRVPRFILRKMVEGQLQGLSKIEKHRARIRPLSAVIDEEAIEAIDLLKIDVEGAELEVLEGIEDRHWPQIRQIVLEAESYKEREPLARARLEAKGFDVKSVQDSVQAAGDYGMIYARR